MTILRAESYKRMPWKNGGGETLEIAIFPSDASVGDFDWRISMATVSTDGAFSRFPQIDRTIVIIDGKAIELSFESQAPVLLDQGSEPYSFAGDVLTVGRLPDGPVADLNVMVRRGLSHSVIRMDTTGLARRPVHAATLFLVALQDTQFHLGTEDVNLGRHDTIDLSGRMLSDIVVKQSGAILLIAIG